MKRFLLLCVLCLTVCIFFCSCAPLQAMLEQQLNTPDTVVIVTASTNNEYSILDPATGLSLEGDTLKTTYISAATPAEQYEALQTAAAAPDTAVLVAELNGKGFAQHAVQLAKKNSIPLLMYGERPEPAVMDSYDMCWYVGFDPALAADLQAEFLVQAFHKEKINDQNGDFKYSLIWMNTPAGAKHQITDHPDSIVHNLKLGGMSIEEPIYQLLAPDTNTLYLNAEALLLPQHNTVSTELSAGDTLLPPLAQTELFICGDTASSEAALRMIGALNTAAEDIALLNFATPLRQYKAVCFGSSELIEAGLNNGTVLGTVMLDKDAATTAILTLASNLANGRSPVWDTSYHFDDGKYLMLEYLVQYGTAGAIE